MPLESINTIIILVMLYVYYLLINHKQHTLYNSQLTFIQIKINSIMNELEDLKSIVLKLRTDNQALKDSYERGQQKIVKAINDLKGQINQSPGGIQAGDIRAIIDDLETEDKNVTDLNAEIDNEQTS